MAFTNVKINGVGDEVYDDTRTALFSAVFQRKDGLISAYYPIIDTGVHKFAVSHSSDLGVTWTQVLIDDIVGNSGLRFWISNLANSKVHFMQNGYHKSALPCIASGDEAVLSVDILAIIISPYLPSKSTAVDKNVVPALANPTVDFLRPSSRTI